MITNANILWISYILVVKQFRSKVITSQYVNNMLSKVAECFTLPWNTARKLLFPLTIGEFRRQCKVNSGTNYDIFMFLVLALDCSAIFCQNKYCFADFKLSFFSYFCLDLTPLKLSLHLINACIFMKNTSISSVNTAWFIVHSKNLIIVDDVWITECWR